MLNKVNVTLNLDFEALVKQKEELVKKAIADKKTNSLLDGILAIIDSIQDQAVENGFTEKQVFGRSFEIK